LGEAGVTVARPVKRADLRVRDLDSITPEDVASALAEAGGCPTGEIKVGTICFSPAGLGSVWALCPLVAARKLGAAGKVRVGWEWAYLEYLTLRQLQCYRCLEIGHTRQRCTNDVDRSERCYRCGDTSHRAAECASAAAKCPLCADLGRPADHRMGGKACRPPTRRRKERKGTAPTQQREPGPLGIPTPAKKALQGTKGGETGRPPPAAQGAGNHGCRRTGQQTGPGEQQTPEVVGRIRGGS
jgi:hypothetical protein